MGPQIRQSRSPVALVHLTVSLLSADLDPRFRARRVVELPAAGRHLGQLGAMPITLHFKLRFCPTLGHPFVLHFDAMLDAYRHKS